MSIVLFNTIILFTSIILISYLTIIIDGYRLGFDEFNLCNPQLDPQSIVDHIGEYIDKVGQRLIINNTRQYDRRVVINLFIDNDS
jgi:hypothetical protein